MKIIAMRNSELVALVDDEDYEFLSQFGWYAQAVGQTHRAITYVQCSQRKRAIPVKMHRLIMDFPEEEIDHRDRNALNNQKGNLRPSNRVGNLQNVGPRCHNKLGIRGVHYDKARGKYHAQYNYAGKKILSKRFGTLEEAVAALDAVRVTS